MTTPYKSLTWAPSEEASKRALGFFTAGGALIGVVGFAVSFNSVMVAAEPYLAWAAWCVPVMVDLAIFVLTGLALFMELHDLGAKWIRLVPNGLSLWTLYLNTAQQHSWFGKSVHAVGPALWVTTVEIAAFAVRKLVGLSDEKRIEGLRRSLWILRPLATWRIWRQMRIHQVTTYAAALDRDAARAAVVGRLRLHHGRMWRQKAPLGERIALRLQGRDPAGVAQVLTDHAATVALLAGTATEPVPEAHAERTESAPEPPAEDTAAPRPKQARRRAPKRSRKAPNAAALLRTEAELIELASALNAQVIAQTGTPVSLRRLKAELHVGQLTAERLRAALAVARDVTPDIAHQAVPEAVPAIAGSSAPEPVKYANGTALD